MILLASDFGLWNPWERLYKSKVPRAHQQVSVNIPSKDAAMKTEEPTPSLGQTLEWLRKELAEMQVQDQRLLLTLRHLHSVLQELRTESAPWEDARSSRGTSPIRARAGSESRGRPPISSQGLAQLLQGTDSRRSSLP
ncbi:uncharacterized protein C20orf202 homolog [Eumetopias jubatus]|uniref:Uncharacterized protein C20orf202-like n=2 Tax=Callorhinus ursinus TaxID=34884 RepID=A0A3Q7PCB4_CALUR|nr:uncharacterized protein C20orf202-like [Callorhinus ursinus]XP_025732068.1 uncharacterized protein C20orf202-like [Callorhinus ursinus]XP_027974641.1 uncharacterized protein C20orf202 homolog [Eumetopias jubatus]